MIWRNSGCPIHWMVKVLGLMKREWHGERGRVLRHVHDDLRLASGIHRGSMSSIQLDRISFADPSSWHGVLRKMMPIRSVWLILHRPLHLSSEHGLG